MQIILGKKSYEELHKFVKRSFPDVPGNRNSTPGDFLFRATSAQRLFVANTPYVLNRSQKEGESDLHLLCKSPLLLPNKEAGWFFDHRGNWYHVSAKKGNKNATVYLIPAQRLETLEITFYHIHPSSTLFSDATSLAVRMLKKQPIIVSGVYTPKPTTPQQIANAMFDLLIKEKMLSSFFLFFGRYHLAFPSPDDIETLTKLKTEETSPNIKTNFKIVSSFGATEVTTEEGLQFTKALSQKITVTTASFISSEFACLIPKKTTRELIELLFDEFNSKMEGAVTLKFHPID
ncbi:hypothetical protein A2230_04515 [candidate division WOR-1 bacterium RIFOXYA2_FULL_36_21]|uniref:Uncharacterized protein n=1 Tax=candidate division WOR-1 bacterium RIFOXYB2_FULL_36_35 TaxID=1802578 RepID=A0A1F4S2Q7_UNCSA|nr:MAG: hypothetical protein A2230_04515 [candidate division WOR-1 bacterium RIFOXYA2_FULL_36_21]OGC14657.1 MAG: hypothetical protein A2290_01245 [candidate division WOR-1 bacterium RIFOXYB2_FULL_36_35]OGC19675.1 MAG: hypothetical protein A2282_02970 [candidate division WOR-1 bacterium RIFOXYA12_FULL_36_13]